MEDKNTLNDTSYTVGSSDAVHGPNMFKNIVMYGFGQNLNETGNEQARKLYMLAALFPTVPAGVLLDVAMGARVWVDSGETLTIGKAGETLEALAARIGVK